MTAQGARRVILGAWLTMIGLATVRRLTAPTQGGLPNPAAFLGSGVLFTMLFGASSFAPGLAAAIAVGVDVGAVLHPYLRNQPALSPLTRLTATLDGISGANVPQPDAPTSPSNPADPSSRGGTPAPI